MKKLIRIIAVMLFVAMILEPASALHIAVADDIIRVLRSGAVTVTGYFPQNASLAANRVDHKFGGAAPVPALAYYDIYAKHGNREISPNGDFTVKITGLDVPRSGRLQVIQVLDDEAAIRKAVSSGSAYPVDTRAFIDAFPDEARAAKNALGADGTVYVEYFTTEDGSLQIIDDRTVTFAASSFSIFIITETALDTNLAVSNATFNVKAGYDVRAGIPGDAVLDVGEIGEDSPGYADYIERTAGILECDIEAMSYVRILDISLYGAESGEHYQPGAPVSVSIELKDDEGAEAENFSVIHFGEQTEILECKTQNGVVSFEATGFSVYVLAADIHRHTYRFFVPTNEEQTVFEEYRIFVDSGEATFTQVIKRKDELVIPQLPSMPDSQTTTFAGWHEGTESGGTVTLSPDRFDFNDLPDITDDREIRLYARFADFAYVIFHEQYNGATDTWPITATRRGELIDGSTSIVISDITVSYDDSGNQHTLEPGEVPPPPAMAFRGWTTADSIDSTNHTITENAPLMSSPITIEGNIHLYPVFASINWLTPVSGPTGSGASYFAPKFFYVDEGLDDLSEYIPTRRGYSFSGWYSDKDGEGNGTGVRITDAAGNIVASSAALAGTGIYVENGKLMFTENVSIYGRWTPAPTPYHVVIWQQKSTDAAGLSASEKNYDFFSSTMREAVTGTLVSPAAADLNRDFTGFRLGSYDSNLEVASDGSTVLNVYYDRKEHTFTFFTNGNTNQYVLTTNPSTVVGTQYRQNGNNYSQIYWRNGAWRTTNSDNGAVHTGARYARVAVGSQIHSVTMLYGSSIKDIWNFTGSNGVTYPQTSPATSWAPMASQLNARLTRLEIMPDEDIVFEHTTTSNQTRYFHYYVEALPGAANTRTYNGVEYSVYVDLTHDFNRIYKSVDFWELEGFSQYQIATENNTNVTNNIGEDTAWTTSWNSNLYFYYLRNTYNIEFRDSKSQDLLDTVGVKYGYDIADAIPGNPAGETGYSFTGWYADPSCTKRVFFTQEDYDGSTLPADRKVLYETMPAFNLQLFAGWSTEWYLIKIDPNGGQLLGNGNYSTWFWKVFGTTELISEYENTKRDYIESLNGTWYYAVKDRSYYGLTDEWDDIEDNIPERTTYYTQDISDDAIVDLGTRYKASDGAFRYANWFEVLYDDDGNEIGEELYNFSRRIDHNITLRLHWKQVGTYFIRYDAGIGTLDGDDSNEDTFRILDSSDYTDHSDVVLTRTVIQPEGYNFIGWHIRGDESDTIYYPGNAVEFQSKFAVKETVGDEVREYLIFDAVYTLAKTAVIIYDANGGQIDSETVDYGRPASDTAPAVEKTCTETEATVSNFENNSGVILSSGEGFSLGNATIVGWNTEPDGSGEHFDLGGSYYVDAEEPVKLYAEWEVRVYFYKNNIYENEFGEGSTWGGTWDPDVYTYDSENDRYYTTVLLGHPVEQPIYTPTDPRNDVVFHFWSTSRYTYPQTGDDPYDFSQPVENELHLWAYWATPITVPIHVVDSTSQTLVGKDDWLRVQGLQVISGTVTDLASSAYADVYVNVPAAQPGEDDYLFAFACLSDSIDNVSEDKIITSVYYDNVTRAAWVSYANGTSGQIPDSEEIYFVYFRYPRTVNIEYKVMQTTGALSDPASLRDARATSAKVGDYDMKADAVQQPVSAPMYWAHNNYPYYSFAIGDADAAGGQNLRFVTSASNSDAARPELRVQNFWNGFRYTTDGGATWVPCGKDITLYVIYYENETKPVIVTINERVIGLEEDMSEQFEYTVVVTETVTNYTRKDHYTRTGNAWSGYNYTFNRSDPAVGQASPPSQVSSYTIYLCNNETDSETVFYTKGVENVPGSFTSEGGGDYTKTVTYTVTTQTITMTQTPKDRFVTVTDRSDTVPEYVYSYTTAEDSTDQEVTFTNTHTPVTVEVHVAEMVNGQLVLRDDTMRGSDCLITLEIGEAVDLTADSPVDPFAGDTDVYAFAGIVYGSHGEGETAVTAAGTADSVAYQPAASGTYYDILLNGSVNEPLENRNVYYVYYRLPRIYYVRQTSAGTFIPYSPVRRNGSAVTLNGHTVAQGDIVAIGENGTVISQSMAGGFRVPPDLDGSGLLSSDYLRIGIGGSNVTNISGLAAANEGKLLYLKVFDGALKWSFDNVSWTAFTEDPAIYAIYRDEQDNRLVIVREDVSSEQDFWYTVSGPGGITIEVCIPAGSDRVTITGVPYGDYTVEEHADWSWRYDSENTKNTTVYGPEDVIPAGATIGDTTLTFSGTRSNNRWMSGNHFVVNQYV